MTRLAGDCDTPRRGLAGFVARHWGLRWCNVLPREQYMVEIVHHDP